MVFNSNISYLFLLLPTPIKLTKLVGKRNSNAVSEKPGITADTAYDTVKLYAWAIKQAGSFDTNKVKQILQKADYKRASGRIVFDAQGGVIKTPVFWLVRNGKFEKI